jgi:hypothetical protein
MKRWIVSVLALVCVRCAEPPTFALQGYYFVGSPDEAMAQSENPKLMLAIQEIIEAIVAKKPEVIIKYVSKIDGAITDAKAFVPYAEVASALTTPEAQLHRVFWDEKYWKETAPKDEIHSYQRVFAKAGEIKVGLFYYSGQECEVRLDFKNRPSLGLMGNPIFRKHNGRWYLLNFF